MFGGGDQVGWPTPISLLRLARLGRVQQGEGGSSRHFASAQREKTAGLLRKPVERERERGGESESESESVGEKQRERPRELEGGGD